MPLLTNTFGKCLFFVFPFFALSPLVESLDYLNGNAISVSGIGSEIHGSAITMTADRVGSIIRNSNGFIRVLPMKFKLALSP